MTGSSTHAFLQRYTREAILFTLGVGIIVGEVVNAWLRNNDVHSAIIVLGSTLCGVGVVGGVSQNAG